MQYTSTKPPKPQMRRLFCFWYRCLRDAARGSVPFANDWQWTVGNPTVAAILPTIAVWLTSILGTDYVSAQHPILSQFIVALLALVATWLLATVIGAVRAASRHYYHEKDRADALHERLFGTERERISIVDLAALAQAEYGWNFREGTLYHFSDFIRALRHGAHEGRIVLEGRLGCRREPEYRKDEYLFHTIPGGHFADYKIECPGYDFDIPNFQITTYSARNGLSDNGRFCDIHAASRNVALHWLETFASKWKGRSAVAQAKSKEARDRFDAELRAAGVPLEDEPEPEKEA